MENIDIKVINHRMMKQILNRCYETKQPIDIKGASGIGKSWAIKELAQEKAVENKKRFFEWNEESYEEKLKLLNPEIARKCLILGDFRLSQMDPTDLKGIPKQDKEYMTWTPDLFFKVISNPEVEGIVFFDEMNLASGSIQAACYQILNDKQIGQMSLSKKILYISAGNRIEDRGGVHTEAAPLNNRRLNFTLQIPYMDQKSEDDFGKWMIKHNVMPLIVSFLYFKPSCVHTFDTKSKDPSFATPRMWHKLSPLIEGLEDEKLIKTIVAGAVGAGVALEFMAFRKLHEQINVRDILDNPEKMSKITDLGMKHAITSGVAELYRNDKKVLNQVMALTMHMQPEFGMHMLRVIKGYCKGNYANEVLACPNWERIRVEYTQYLM